MNAEKVYSLEEQKANRKLWVEALRSGKYQQGREALRNNADKFCCLGVLADIAGCPWTFVEDRGLYGVAVSPDGTGFEVDNAPPEAMAFVGLRNPGGGMAEDRALWLRNDEGATFAEIAAVIETEPEGLFLPVPAKSEV